MMKADLLQGKMMEVKGADHRLAKKVVQEDVGCQKVMKADFLQGKMMEVKGADYRLAKKVVQEGVGCLEVMMVLMHEMAEILETVRMAE